MVITLFSRVKTRSITQVYNGYSQRQFHDLCNLHNHNRRYVLVLKTHDDDAFYRADSFNEICDSSLKILKYILEYANYRVYYYFPDENQHLYIGEGERIMKNQDRINAYFFLQQLSDIGGFLYLESLQ